MRAVSVPLVIAAFSIAAACGPPRDGCEQDNDCGGSYVCARNGECLPASDVHPVRVTWTVRGMTASPTLCGTAQNLYLYFNGYDVNDSFGYEPVPCEAGLFTIDKLPSRFTSVEIGTGSRSLGEKAIDSQGNVAFDLAP